MKRIIIATLFVCSIFLQGIAQNNDLSIYDSLQFEKGIAVKKVIVDYTCFGKDPIATTNARDSLIAVINKSIMLNSNTAMEFNYNNKHYYISLHDRCLPKARLLFDEKMKSNIESIKVMITIVFYENVYYRGKPYSVITDIERE